MSVSDDEPYSTIFASLNHPVRRKILRMLSQKPMSFSEILEALGVSSSFLTYHIENLGELVSKTDGGKYRLSSFGEAAIATMTKVEDIPITAPQQQMKSRKVVGRSAAIVLGIICILLIAGLGGALAYYTMIIHNKENELSSANNTISQLNTNVTNLQNQDKQLQTWLDGNETLLNQTQANNTNLQNQVNNLHIGNTENSTIWANNKNVHTNANVSVAEWFEYVPSAGYVSIRVSSNNNSTYVALFYLLNSTNIGPTTYQISVGFGGTVVFPVLPTSMGIGISVGNFFGEATYDETITYYY